MPEKIVRILDMWIDQIFRLGLSRRKEHNKMNVTYYLCATDN